MLPLSAWVFGMLIAFYPTLISGFALIQGGRADTRWNNFILEHGYRWLMGFPNHEEFFFPPVVYPTTLMNSSDLLLGVAPVYWLWRLAAFEPDTAYQFWMMSLATLNFVACYFLLKQGFRVGVPGASVGAMVFAFGAAQSCRVVHQQLIPQFFVLSSLLVLFYLFREGGSQRGRCLAIVAFFLLWTVQFYTSYNVFFLMGLPLGAAFLWALVVSEWRKGLFRLIRRSYLCLAVGALLGLLLIWPLLTTYVEQAVRSSYRLSSSAVLPKPYIWFLMGKSNLLYGWIRTGPFDYLVGNQFSQGVGVIVSLLAVIGLIKARTSTGVKIVVVGFLTAAVLVTHLTYDIGLWRYIKDFIPGAKAIRAPARIGMIQMLPVAIGLGFFFQWLVERRYWKWLVLLLVFCLLEQLHVDGPRISKQVLRQEVADAATQVDPECLAFLLIPTEPKKGFFELSAWTALATGKPSINHRRLRYQSLQRTDALTPRAILERWGRRHKASIEGVQIIILKPAQRRGFPFPG